VQKEKEEKERRDREEEERKESDRALREKRAKIELEKKEKEEEEILLNKGVLLKALPTSTILIESGILKGVLKSFNSSHYINHSHLFKPIFTFAEFFKANFPSYCFKLLKDFTKSDFELMLPTRFETTQSTQNYFCEVGLVHLQVTFNNTTRPSFVLYFRYTPAYQYGVHSTFNISHLIPFVGSMDDEHQDLRANPLQGGGDDVTPTSPTSNASTSPSPHKGPITRSMMRKIHMGLSQDDQVNHGLFTLFTWAKEISKI